MDGLISARAFGIDQLTAEFAGFGKESDLAELRALGSVASTARTRTTREVASQTGIQQKHIRPRLTVFRGNRRDKFAKVWGGTFKPIRMKEIGLSKVVKFAPPGARPFVATMKSGHTGAFYRSRGRTAEPRSGPGSGSSNRRWGQPDLPISEVRKYVTGEFNEVLPGQVDAVYSEKFVDLYWNDLTFRLNRIRRSRRRVKK